MLDFASLEGGGWAVAYNTWKTLREVTVWRLSYRRDWSLCVSLCLLFLCLLPWTLTHKSWQEDWAWAWGNTCIFTETLVRNDDVSSWWHGALPPKTHQKDSPPPFSHSKVIPASLNVTRTFQDPLTTWLSKSSERPTTLKNRILPQKPSVPCSLSGRIGFKTAFFGAWAWLQWDGYMMPFWTIIFRNPDWL